MPLPARLASPGSLDDLLLYRINRLLGVAGSMVIRLCEGCFGITRREWRVMAVLGVPGAAAGMLSSQLAERAQLDRARTSRAVTSLVTKGLLDRQTQPGDRRQARVTLTPAGRVLHDALFPLEIIGITPALVADLQSVPYDASIARQYGFALGGMAAQNLAVAFSDGSKASRRGLHVALLVGRVG